MENIFEKKERNANAAPAKSIQFRLQFFLIRRKDFLSFFILSRKSVKVKKKFVSYI